MKYPKSSVNTSPVWKSSIDDSILTLRHDRFFGCYKWAVELWEKVGTKPGLPAHWLVSEQNRFESSDCYVKPNNNKR